ncbi:WbqC family protein [Aliivibrio fischeri]|uniref:WbqC family protein n=1 Tax=Aliivibrio fischeri TaxID=668 RepID=UPI003551B002
MKAAIMQPYFFPYIGYFQLINYVDKFVVYDNIKYTKKSWINRNRFYINGKDEMFSLPLKKDSDYLDVVDRRLSDTFEKEAQKLLRKVESAYRKAPNYQDGISIFKQCILFESKNLFDFILNSIKTIVNYLDIDTEIIISSSLNSSRDLKCQDRVIDICQEVKATEYVNPFSGMDLYEKSSFFDSDIKLCFIKLNDIEYSQNPKFDFIGFLSIIDVIMWNDKKQVKKFLNEFSIYEA